MARKTLTDKSVAALKPRNKLYAQPDPPLPGHYIRVSPTGGQIIYCRGAESEGARHNQSCERGAACRGT